MKQYTWKLINYSQEGGSGSFGPQRLVWSRWKFPSGARGAEEAKVQSLLAAILFHSRHRVPNEPNALAMAAAPPRAWSGDVEVALDQGLSRWIKQEALGCCWETHSHPQPQGTLVRCSPVGCRWGAFPSWGRSLGVGSLLPYLSFMRQPPHGCASQKQSGCFGSINMVKWPTKITTTTPKRNNNNNNNGKKKKTVVIMKYLDLKLLILLEA